jgi:hypothetical protein
VNRSLLSIPINLDIGLPIIETKISQDGQEDIPVKLVVDLDHRNALFLSLDDKKKIPTSFLEHGSNMGLSKDIVDGASGQLILNRFNVILDYKNKQTFLAPSKFYNQPFEYDMAGLVLEQYRDGFYYPFCHRKFSGY